MKIGDLVRCRDDEYFDWGLGLVIDEQTRMVKVWWFCGAKIDDGDMRHYIDDWNWKTNLETASR